MVEKNISLMEEVANDILKSVPIVLNLLKTQEQLDLKYLNFISEILLFVKPEFQPEIIMQLADIRDLRILSSFSEILLNIKQYEKVITLLEPRILDINNDQEEESEVIYFCRYNLSLAYKGRGKLSLAEEQLLLILKNKPNDVDSIYSLVNVYIHNQKHEEAKNLIKNAPKDLKILMEMTLDLPSISESKLKDINLDNLPNNSKEQLLCFHFTAKYNSTPEKICNEENLKKELTEISKSIKD
ncbi:MAG: tetratricopeptide repeat protein, partial [Rickettsia endosymbiont of Pentastiridius leporinus]